MFSPEMMRMAQEQMSRMSPDQMAAMQKQMGSMSPEMMQAAMSQMKNMSPDDLRTAQEKMQGMSPEDIAKASESAGSMGSQLKAQQEYAYNASMKLKTDGNYLVGTQKHSEAIEKYTRAIDNLKDHQTDKAAALRLSCQLNLALCYLKTGNNDAAISTCTDVLRRDIASLKATYRRGQAYQAKGEMALALADLKRSHQLAPDDETVEQSYKDIKELIKKERIKDEDLKAAEKKLEAEREELKAAKAKEDAEKAQMESMLRQSQMQSAAAKSMDANPDMMKTAMEEMQKNPEMIKNMSAMLKDMSPEQLAAMSKQAPGMPEITPDMAKMVAQQMENMKPEDLEAMAKMAGSMGAGAKGRDAGTASSSSGGPSKPNIDGMDQGEMLKTMEEQMKNPEMRKMLNNMMKNITPEQMKSMAGVGGMKMTDAQAEAMAKQMQGMKEEDLERMLKYAAMGQRAKEALMKNKLIVLAVLILLVGILLRWLGWA